MRTGLFLSDARIGDSWAYTSRTSTMWIGCCLWERLVRASYSVGLVTL